MKVHSGVLLPHFPMCLSSSSSRGGGGGGGGGGAGAGAGGAGAGGAGGGGGGILFRNMNSWMTMEPKAITME